MRKFDPDKVARYEKASWDAYYDRNWLRAFWLLMQLNREQFNMSVFTAFTAALDTARASMAFAPLGREDIAKAKRFIEKFYAKARRSLNLKADAHTLAELEITYWIVHRRLAVARAKNPNDGDIEPMIRAFQNLHAALFDSTPDAQRASAEWRARAAEAVDLITSKRSTDVAGDWRRIEEYLRKAYRSVTRES